MPDSLAHTSVNLITTAGADRKVVRATVLAGALLPDIAGKSLKLFLGLPHWGAAPTHSLAGIVLMAYALSFFFVPPHRPRAFSGLFLGQGLHLLLDYTKTSYLPAYDLFFPVPLQVAQMNLVWDWTWMYLSPILAVICFVVFRRPIYQEMFPD